MRDAVITAAVRSPIGKRNGGLAAMHAAELSALMLTLRALTPAAISLS